MTALSGIAFIRPPRKEWRSLTRSTLEEIFMPLNWRTSCTEDYLTYQTYDSLQAIFSSVAGLLATRESLLTLGVSRAEASVEDALWLSMASEAVSRAAGILFTWRYGLRFDVHCKRFRFLADLFNDAGLVLGTASSSVHPSSAPSSVLRSLLVVSAALLRALCGVCAGASKAALTNHFAVRDASVADINAKDASQETIIYLLGLGLGALLVPCLTSRPAIWSALALLVALHLAANHRAVKSVRLATLNQARLAILLQHYFDDQHDGDDGDRGDGLYTPQDVARHENLLFPQPSRFAVTWITDHNARRFVHRVSFREERAILAADDAGNLGLCLRSDGNHLDIMEAIFNTGKRDAKDSDSWQIFREKAVRAGWDFDRDALGFNGLYYATTETRKDQ